MSKRSWGLAAFAAVLILGGASPALVACSGTGASSPLPVSKTDVMKAEISVEVAFNAVVSAKNQAQASGVLTGAKSAQADALAKRGYALLQPIRAAADAGINPDVSALSNLIAQLAALAPGSATK